MSCPTQEDWAAFLWLARYLLLRPTGERHFPGRARRSSCVRTQVQSSRDAWPRGAPRAGGA
eukprot:1187615-Alexandrium_andersonii.AAC.1